MELFSYRATAWRGRMNLFVTIIFGICCCIAEFSPVVQCAEQNCSYRLMLILLATLVAPVMAMLQTRWVADSLIRARSSWDLQNAIVSRLSRGHCAVWAATGLFIFAGLKWPALVAMTEIAGVPVLYELVLLSPLILSLIGSWFAFYDIQQLYRRPGKRWNIDWHRRWAFVGVRIRMHLMTMLVPLVALLTGLRFAHLIHQFSLPQIVLAGALVGLWVSAVLPFLFLFIWETRPITDAQLLKHLQDICQSSGVWISRMRVWKTGNQIANAAVTGLLPGFRIVLLTDALLKHFTTDEVAAIVRHEVGHVKLMHLPLKIFFVILPMVALIVDQTHTQGIHHWIATALEETVIFGYAGPQIAPCLIAVLFIIYLFTVLRWLNHRLEHEADLFAAMELTLESNNETNRHTCAALEKLAAISPQHRTRSTFLHPAILSRIQLLEAVAQDSSIAKKFQRSLHRRHAMILLPWLVLLAIAAYAFING